MQDLQRLPRGPEGGSSWRLGKGPRAAAGTRSGASGTTMGTASLQGAFSAAAVLVLRATPAGPQGLPRVENNHGQGHALPVRAQQRARAVSDRLTRPQACARQKVLQGAGSGARAPIALLAGPGLRLSRALCRVARRASRTPKRA